MQEKRTPSAYKHRKFHETRKIDVFLSFCLRSDGMPTVRPEHSSNDIIAETSSRQMSNGPDSAKKKLASQDFFGSLVSLNDIADIAHEKR